MYPVINIFGREITTYAICALIGILLSGFLMCKLTGLAGKDENDTIILLAIISVGVLLGGHILFALTNIDRFSLFVEIKSLSDLFNAVQQVFGGAVFYGGLIGGIIFGFVGAKILKVDVVSFLDIAGIGVPLFHAIARVGCFLGGCCYGIESDFGFTAYGNQLVEAVNGISRFPVQLLEALCNLIIFLLIFVLYHREKLKGKLFYLYLILYSIVRFFDEFLRGDEIRGFIFGISTSQFISICLFIFALIVFLKPKKTISCDDRNL